MTGNVVNVELKLTAKGVEEQRKATAEIANNLERANKAGSTAAVRSVTAPGNGAILSATKASTAINEREYGMVRGSVGTGAAGRDFAKQAQGLGGLVALYATFAANIFAVGAAYEALNKAAAAERLTKATEMMSVQVGVNLKSISNNLIEASGNALSFQDAMQFTNIGTSAGLAGKQIESLTKIARGAASALGRDVNDSIRRIIQGTAKQEQEILDELGIFVKSKQAFDKYAQAIGVKVDALTGTQRTQAYANEVERLGKKWEAFAEIDDPFSRFSATGKNALNDLLQGINTVIKPILSLFAESEGAIKSLIVLISTALVKKALPELGNVLTNLFKFDKTKISKEFEDLKAKLEKEYSNITNSLAKKQKEFSKLVIPEINSSAILGASGAMGYTRGVSEQKGISNTKLINTFTAEDISRFKTYEDVQKGVSVILKEQLANKKTQAATLETLISRGIVEKETTYQSVVLGKEANIVASNIFKLIEARNAGLITSVQLEKEVLALTTQQTLAKQKLDSLPDQKSIEKASSVLEVADFSVTEEDLEDAAGVITDTNAIIENSAAKQLNAEANLTAAAAGATNSEALLANTISSERNSIAGLRLQGSLILTAAAMKVKAAATMSATVSAELMTIAMEKGMVATMKQTVAALASATTGLIGFAMGTRTAAEAMTLMGTAAKGLMATLNMGFMVIMILITVYQLLEEQIKKILPEWAKMLLGMDEGSKKAQAAKEKLDEYNKSLGYSAAQMQMLNEVRSKGFESIEEEARYADTLLKNILNTTEAYKKYTEEKQAAAAEDRLDTARKAGGKSFSEDAYRLRELAEAYKDLIPAETTVRMKVLAENMAIATGYMANAKKGTADYVYWENRRIEAMTEAARINNDIVLPTTQKYASDTAASASAVNLLSKEFEVLGDSAKKARDPVLNLGEHGKVVYTNLSNIFSSSVTSASTFTDTLYSLSGVIQQGGIGASKAAILYSILGNIQVSISRRLRQGTLSPEQTAEAWRAAIAEMKGQIDAASLGLAGIMDKPTKTKTPKEYTKEAQQGFRELTAVINSAKLAQKTFDLESANTKAINDRTTSILGYKNATTIAEEENTAVLKSEKDKQLAILSAFSTYKREIERSSSTEESRGTALTAYQNAINEALASETASDAAAKLATANNQVTSALTQQSQAYELLSAKRSANNTLADQELEQLEAYVAIYNSKLSLSKEDQEYEDRAKTVRSAALKYAQDLQKIEDDTAKKINDTKTKSTDSSGVLTVNKDAYVEAINNILALGDVSKTTAADVLNHNVSMADSVILASTAAAERSKSMLLGAQDGFKEYDSSIKDFASSTKEVVTNAFKGMEDALLNFVKTGKLDFASLADSIISDLIRIQIQKNIMPGLSAGMDAGVSFISSLFAANGAVFDGNSTFAKGGVFGNTEKFAKGGTFTNSIVSSPTVFKFAQGTGLMGEAGPEAIMPLKRDSNGTLGVRANVQQSKPANVTINIVESAEKAGTQERKMDNGTDMITVFVEKVKSAIASDISRGRGAVTGALSKTYGLNRVAGAY